MELFEKDSVYTLCANTASLLFFFHLMFHFECSAQFFLVFSALWIYVRGMCAYVFAIQQP